MRTIFCRVPHAILLFMLVPSIAYAGSICSTRFGKCQFQGPVGGRCSCVDRLGNFIPGIVTETWSPPTGGPIRQPSAPAGSPGYGGGGYRHPDVGGYGWRGGNGGGGNSGGGYGGGGYWRRGGYVGPGNGGPGNGGPGNGGQGNGGQATPAQATAAWATRDGAMSAPATVAQATVSAPRCAPLRLGLDQNLCRQNLRNRQILSQIQLMRLSTILAPKRQDTGSTHTSSCWVQARATRLLSRLLWSQLRGRRGFHGRAPRLICSCSQ